MAGALVRNGLNALCLEYFEKVINEKLDETDNWVPIALSYI